MEPVVGEPPKRRGRKRKINDVQNVAAECGGRKKAPQTRSLKLVGRYVRKDFQGSGMFLGKIMFYESGLYKINYEDGDLEDLDSVEVKLFLVEDDDLIGEWLDRKEKLDALLLSKEARVAVPEIENGMEFGNIDQADSPLGGKLNNAKTGIHKGREAVDDGYDADSFSDSCEDTLKQDAGSDIEEPPASPPELPPSSGHIGVPEEYVSHLFSVHSFLRSFSVPLFLYPFGLDDFVGALNCSVANSLLDSVHVALLRVLKRHIERLSSSDSVMASKCIRCMDWNLLDTLTWPVFLMHYLVIMGYTNGPDWRDFCIHALERNYYSLSTGRKLVALQILCDNVLDSEEVRAEIDRREESEVGLDCDASISDSNVGAVRVNGRLSRSTQQLSGQQPEVSSAGYHSTRVSGRVDPAGDEDGNGDECCLCGMDGLLLCCDGCPLSYHTRCLGVSKMHMPEGSWYCPQCALNKVEPKILKGTALRGGHNFGLDRHGHIFIATCDHLLVLNASDDSRACLRYYNRQDIPKVLHSLNLKKDHAVVYVEICRGIIQYWELPEDILPCHEMSDIGIQFENCKGGDSCTAHSDNRLGQSVLNISVIDRGGECESAITAGDAANSCLTLNPSAGLDELGNSDSARESSLCTEYRALCEPTSISGSTSQLAGKNRLSQQSTSSVVEAALATTRNINFDYGDLPSDASRHAKMFPTYLENKNKAQQDLNGKPFDNCIYMGISFKATGYLNNFLHGGFAASAAANLAILSSEENQVSDFRTSSNRRNAMSDNVALQVKAFSSAAMRFFWPNAEKKLSEVPRERCSWCFYCKATVVSKKGCLLNAAASNSIKGATKTPSGVRSSKNCDGRLADISMYILFIEKSLTGLVVGPFLYETFKKRWRKQVEHATTTREIKTLLLELEENIRDIAFSGDWIKLFGGGSTRSSICTVEENVSVQLQKHKPGRRGRKPSRLVEVASDNYLDEVRDCITWWRGDKLSKLLFERGILPSAVSRKAALQCGFKKIHGIQYVDGDESLKISRQLMWRSAVERSKNIAQLAVQVRHFDSHVRWSDLVRPEQTAVDGKGCDAEAFAFRNAFICDKKILQHEIQYCIAFGIQKHLPSRLMKSVAEVERIQDDGIGRYWFSEARIPLYLIKEYEENLERSNPGNPVSRLHRRLQKAYGRNIFNYLRKKQDVVVQINCNSCGQDIFYWNAVKCCKCQGFSHKKCATSSAALQNKGIELFVACKKCFEHCSAAQVQSRYGSPTSPLLLQAREFSKADAANGYEKSVGNHMEETEKYSSEQKLKNISAIAKRSKNSKCKSWGLIWKKKNLEDTGMDFRHKNILLKGKSDMGFAGPSCRLCCQPYNADLTYIRCETCSNWFHADALELDESKISSLMGFKCSKCRRTKSPPCPYVDPEKKKALELKFEGRAPKPDASLPIKSEVSDMSSVDPLVFSPLVQQCSENLSEVDNEWNNSNMSGSAPRKLPVRRHIKQEREISSAHELDPFLLDFSAFDGAALNPTGKLPVRRPAKAEYNLDFHASQNETFDAAEGNGRCTQDLVTSPQAQWSVPLHNYDDGVMLDYEGFCYDDSEFEPQTYFSFHELLASDDGCGPSNGDETMFPTENWEASSPLEMSCDQEEPIIPLETSVEIPACHMCSHSELYPDLSCEMCGIRIHSHCSPWVESSTRIEVGWTCGNCRGWR